MQICFASLITVLVRTENEDKCRYVTKTLSAVVSNVIILFVYVNFHFRNPSLWQ